MSGKQPRVKGNLKPTSSSRAAELLQGDTSAINAFKANPALAFSQLSRNIPSSSGRPKATSQSQPQSQTPDVSVSPSSGASTSSGLGLDQIDAQLASQLKRLGKNDSKTKMRALTELKTYVDEHSWDSGLNTMLLAWPPVFKRHVFDSDRRVRAAVAEVHAALVVKCGKRLAAHLKLLIGPWTASFFDPHREAARSLRQAFEAVFPEAKRPEVYAYCLSELIEYASDIIISQTPETLSDPRFADTEEMRGKYEQAVGSAFGVLALVIDEAPVDKLRELSTEFDSLLGNNQVLSFVSSSAVFVRRNIYRLVRTTMLKYPDLAQNSYLTLSRILLSNCFAENDPNAHGDMWDSVLLLTKSYPQAWAELSAKGKSSGAPGKKNSPVDRLFEFLKQRCRLAPTISYPSILALLANLPASVLDEPSFQPEFHKALWQGASLSAPSSIESTESALTKSSTASEGSASFSRPSYQESVALVSAISECFSFLWTRTLKAASDPNTCSLVGKEAAKEIDRLWHFYLQYPQFAQEMAIPIVKLYCKLESLAYKYEPAMLERIWAQASWFALQRLSGDSIYPIVFLTVQIARLDASTHNSLVENANKLLVAFCQLAAQLPDAETARSLIHVLSQLAPNIVFKDEFASTLATRLKIAGSINESVSLLLSQAQHISKNSGSIVEAAKAVDSFVATTLENCSKDTKSEDSIRAFSDAYRTISIVLSALPNSGIAKNPDWNTSARLPSLEPALIQACSVIPSSAELLELHQLRSPPSLDFIKMCCQVLLVYFAGTGIVSEHTISSVFGWMEQVFSTIYLTQWSRKINNTSSKLKPWITVAHEVLVSWAVLARDPAAGPRFVRYWLRRSGSQAHSALGLLFDFAISAKSTTDDASPELQSKLYSQAQQAWSATEAQLERLHLGFELAVTLSESISNDLGDLNSLKDPSHLARLASSVYKHICPQDNKKALDALVSSWLLDNSKWQKALEQDANSFNASISSAQYLATIVNACGSGLRQAVEDYAPNGQTKSYHTLTHWLASSAVATSGWTVESRHSYDAFGLTRFARRAIFSIEFLQACGRLSVFSLAKGKALVEFVLNMTLSYVLLRESLLLAAHYSGFPEIDNGARSSMQLLSYFGVSIVQVDTEDSTALLRVDATAKAIQDTISDMLGLLVVHESSIPSEPGSDDIASAIHAVKIPRDPSRWLGLLMECIAITQNKDSSNEQTTIWEQLAVVCISRCYADMGAPWSLVLGTLVEWCHWACPLDAADLETAVAGTLSRKFSKPIEAAQLSALLAIVHALSLQQQCSHSPIMHSALLDMVSQLSHTVEEFESSSTNIFGMRLRLVAQLEILAELLPTQSASLDAGTLTPKILRVLFSIVQTIEPRPTADTRGGYSAHAIRLPVILAALVVTQRFAVCVPAINEADAVGLARLCLKWSVMELDVESIAVAAAVDSILVAVSRAVSSISHAAECLVDDSDRVMGPTMQQLGKELEFRCVLSERPLPDGVHAVAQLVQSGYFAAPGFEKLYPVLNSASPHLAVELVLLALSETDVCAYIGPHVDALVRLVAISSKTLADLAVPFDEFAEAVRSDEYVRSAGLRLLAAMLLLLRCADALAVGDAQKFEELSDMLSSKQVLDGAMPWACALLGLTNSQRVGSKSSTGNDNIAAFRPKLWDVASELDWDMLVSELLRNPAGEHLFGVIAYHVVFGTAWTFPSTLRSWWAGLPQAFRGTSVGVEQFVAKYLSPVIIEKELERIKRQQGEDNSQEENNKGLSPLTQTLEEYNDAKVRTGTMQVTLLYTVDDSTLEMAVKLPPTYPLVLPTIESVKRIAVSEKRWRAWLVAAQAQMARNRRLDVVCAQVLGNVGAHFAGVEDCAICYSAVGTLDNSLPNKQCRTCKNKFHRMCLFKWFNTSNQSTCPLCRNLF